MKRVAVFCGSSVGTLDAYRLAAVAVGEALVKRGLGLVYGGGRVGMMGVVADTVIAKGGEVRGVIPKSLATKELAHVGVTELTVVNSMHERKALMAELSDAFIAMPGGYGTLDELYEIMTWAQLGFHHKPIGVLNVEGYFDPLLAFTERAIKDGFVKDEYRNLVVVEREAERLLSRLETHKMPITPKWIGLNET